MPALSGKWTVYSDSTNKNSKYGQGSPHIKKEIDTISGQWTVFSFEKRPVRVRRGVPAKAARKCGITTDELRSTPVLLPGGNVCSATNGLVNQPRSVGARLGRVDCRGWRCKLCDYMVPNCEGMTEIKALVKCRAARLDHIKRHHGDSLSTFGTVREEAGANKIVLATNCGEDGWYWKCADCPNGIANVSDGTPTERRMFTVNANYWARRHHNETHAKRQYKGPTNRSTVRARASKKNAMVAKALSTFSKHRWKLLRPLFDTHTQGASKIILLDMSAMWRVSGSSQQMAVHKLVPTACKDQNLQTQIPCEIGRADPNGARHYYQTIYATMGPSAWRGDCCM